MPSTAKTIIDPPGLDPAVNVSPDDLWIEVPSGDPDPPAEE